MKVKVERNKKEFETVDVIFPLYAIVENEEDTDYVKIEEDSFAKLSVGFVSTEITKFKKRTPTTTIAEIWWNNQCSKEEWDEQLKCTQDFLSSF